MAVEFKPKKDPNNPNAANQQMQIGGVQGAVAPGSGAGPGVGAAPQKPTSSGRFTNLQTYLKANQSSNLGQTIGGKFQEKAQAVGNQINQSKQQFEQQAQQALQPFQGAEEFGKQAAADPTQFVKDQNNLQRFDQVRSGVYRGPKQIDNVGTLQANVKNIQSVGQLGNTEGGRFNLLRTLFNKPTYSRGQQTLDNLILQGSPDQTEALQKLKSIGAQTGRTLQETVGETVAAGQRNVGETNRISDVVKGDLSNTEKSFQEALMKRVEETRKEVGERQDIFEKNLKQRNELTDDDLIYLGVPQTQRETFRFLYDLARGQGDKQRVSQVILKRPGGESGAGAFGGTTTSSSGSTRRITGDAAQKYLGKAMGENVDGEIIESINQGGAIDLTRFLQKVNLDSITKDNVAGLEDFDKAQAINRLFSRGEDQSFLTNKDSLGKYDNMFKFNANDALKALNDYYASGYAEELSGENKEITDDKLGDYINYLGKVAPDALRVLAPFGGLGDTTQLGVNMASSQPEFVSLTRAMMAEQMAPLVAIKEKDPMQLLKTPIGSYQNLLENTPGLAKQLVNPTNYKTLLQGSSNVIQNIINPMKQAEQAKQAAAKAAEAARNILRSINPFCLAEGSMIDMADGSKKAVEKLTIGDEVAFGGTVLGYGVSLCDSVYAYNGVLMSESHAVHHDNTWVRAKDCSVATKLEIPVAIRVYPVFTQRHIMICNGNILADFSETDQGYSVNDADRLQFMNTDLAFKEFVNSVKERLNVKS